MWAWAIVHGFKRIENRSWGTSHRGPLAIHASRNRSRNVEAIEFLRSLAIVTPKGVAIDEMRGKVIGVCDLVDCFNLAELQRPSLLPCDMGRQEAASDDFAEGPVCWVLENPRLLGEPLAVAGQMGLWDVDIDQRPLT